jgi:hypothetical protein
MKIDSRVQNQIAEKLARLREAEEEASDYRKKIEFLTECVEANLMPDTCAELLVRYANRYADAMDRQNQILEVL